MIFQSRKVDKGKAAGGRRTGQPPVRAGAEPYPSLAAQTRSTGRAEAVGGTLSVLGRWIRCHKAEKADEAGLRVIRSVTVVAADWWTRGIGIAGLVTGGNLTYYTWQRSGPRARLHCEDAHMGDAMLTVRSIGRAQFVVEAYGYRLPNGHDYEIDARDQEFAEEQSRPLELGWPAQNWRKACHLLGRSRRISPTSPTMRR